MQLLNRINIGQALNKLNSQENRALSGIGLAILAGFLFVSSDTIVKLVREELPVAMVVWGRFIMHLLIMFILFPGKKIIPLLKVKDNILTYIMSIVSLLYFYLKYRSLCRH